MHDRVALSLFAHKVLCMYIIIAQEEGEPATEVKIEHWTDTRPIQPKASLHKVDPKITSAKNGHTDILYIHPLYSVV